MTVEGDLCPLCQDGIMCFHDIGYVECDSCNFTVIWDPETETYDQGESRALDEWENADHSGVSDYLDG